MNLSSEASSAYTLARNASLHTLTTFQVQVKADCLVTLNQTRALPDLLALLPNADELLFLGGGSNVLLTRDFTGTVVHIRTRGIEIIDVVDSSARIRVAAGENWDNFVRWSLAQGFAGLENLILIPGSVGAAPMQNIGAYGVEVREFVHAVEVWDRKAGQFVRFDNTGCDFAYRNSVFKRSGSRYLITDVEFELPKERPMLLEYAGVKQELETMGISQPNHQQVGAAIENVRKRKLPDPARLGNAGSFFKNPIVSSEQAKSLTEKHHQLPAYAMPDDTVKLSAAWLLEQAGFKAKRAGDAGFSEQHALVLVNYGNASGAELWRLAQQARDAVAEKFAVTLEPEPLVL